jgi:nucleotide-binding universal stress UspA family protein
VLDRGSEGAVSVVESSSVEAALMTFTPAGVKNEIDLPGYLLQKARNEMSALRALASDVACVVRVEQVTEPWMGILAAADAVDADLIVLGSHGYRGWDRVLGTTAGKVANSSHRNVLVVHARGDAADPQSRRPE